jgi:hypothetical protein
MDNSVYTFYRSEYRSACTKAIIACIAAFVLSMALLTGSFFTSHQLLFIALRAFVVASWAYSVFSLGLAAATIAIDRHEKRLHEQAN